MTMTVELSDEQHAAFDKVQGWMRDPNGKQVFRLEGGAGTGKTTLARLLGTTAVCVLYAAPTAKAAAVLTQKGCPAQTVHQLIYQPQEMGKSRLEELKKEERDILDAIGKAVGPLEQLKAELREVREKVRAEEQALDRPFFALKTLSALRDADLLGLDESSMVDDMMGADILSFGTRVLALGDPFQLPPVRGQGFFSRGAPDVLLEHVHRQALGSPILELATIVRNGRPLPAEFDEDNEKGSAAILRGRPDPETVMKADQLLCGRNATRVSLNKRCRELLGRGGELPEAGDRLVCLKNNHDIGLANGTIWHVTKCLGNGNGRLVLDLVSDDGAPLLGLIVHEAPFLGKEVGRWEMRDAEMFDYGYALTVHKAQGSQWDNVVLFDDWTQQGRREWLYTGITRAAKQLLIVQ